MAKEIIKNKAARGRVVKKRGIGRPPGSPNKKSDYPRNTKASGFHCSEGFKKVVDMLIQSGQYLSQSDVYHDALVKLAAGKRVDKEHFDFWKGKIQ